MSDTNHQRSKSTAVASWVQLVPVVGWYHTLRSDPRCPIKSVNNQEIWSFAGFFEKVEPWGPNWSSYWSCRHGP